MMFKIQWNYRDERTAKKEGRKLLEAVPWDFVKAHDKQVWTNHRQTMEQLNDRGGLDIVELWWVLRDEKYGAHHPGVVGCEADVKVWLDRWTRQHN